MDCREDGRRWTESGQKIRGASVYTQLRRVDSSSPVEPPNKVIFKSSISVTHTDACADTVI